MVTRGANPLEDFGKFMAKLLFRGKKKSVKHSPLLANEIPEVYENLYQDIFSVFKNSPENFKDINK